MNFFLFAYGPGLGMEYHYREFYLIYSFKWIEKYIKNATYILSPPQHFMLSLEQYTHNL